MSNFMFGVIGVVSTLFIYLVFRKIYQMYPNPLLLPVLPSTVVIVTILLLSDIPYNLYMIGGGWIDWLLGPAVVALAYPLYNNWSILKRYSVSLLIGVFVGAVIGTSTGLLLAKWLSIEKMLIYSLVPKNTTTPIAMDVANSLGGVPSLAAVFVMVVGIAGAIWGPYLLKWSGVHHFLGKGVGLGSASHAMGTTKALENSEQEGAVSTVAMTLSAIIVSVISPVMVYLFL